MSLLINQSDMLSSTFEFKFVRQWSLRRSKKFRRLKREQLENPSRHKDDRETMIVFVYDTECLKDEADDPVNAVLYFHPSWVSDTQKVALCGQLMGMSYFLKDCFFKPRIIALQNGKFALREFGRFILAVGTDRNITDELLLHRADLLSSLFRFFHRDLNAIHQQFASPYQPKNLSEKLYHIFETYLPILQYNGNIFQNVVKLRMPKTASHIFLDAMQILQSCQATKGILGGAILYHNKVVATQLSDSVTKHIVIADPFHIRPTAEQISSTEFHIPNGVLMLVVYVDIKEYERLKAEAHKAQTLHTMLVSQGGPLPFQYAKRKMKRDKSLIFTHIPEEGGSSGGVGATSRDSGLPLEERDKPLEKPQRPRSLLMRPTHLPLHRKSLNAKELPESGFASINFDENDSYPEFIGRTSVCSTPLAENKVLAVGNVMSICANPEDDGKSQEVNGGVNKLGSSLKADFDKFLQNFMSNKQPLERRNSFQDFQESFKKLSKRFSLKSSSNTKSKTDVNRNGGGSSETPDFIENDDADGVRDRVGESLSEYGNKSTIIDPTGPFQEFLEKYYKLWDGTGGDDAKKEAEIAELVAEFKAKYEARMQEEAQLLKNSPNFSTIRTKDRNLNLEPVGLRAQTPKTPLDKKTLSLPLKPLTLDLSTPANENPPTFSRKQPGGVPLTPLMAKLSVLAMNEEQRGSNWDSTVTTPGAPMVDIQTPLYTARTPFGRKSSFKCDDAVDALSCVPPGASAEADNQSGDGLKRLELYVCGQQNMTLLLLMEEGSARQQEIVQKMFDLCVSRFPSIESQLNQTLNVNVAGDKREGSYSFICVDDKWDVLQSGGPWHPVEMSSLEGMHRDFQSDKSLTELTLRTHDSVLYGYHMGRTELYYKEPAQAVAGLPLPSDPIAQVALRAKDRLENDHSYVML